MNKSILFVDDEPAILRSIKRSVLAITTEWDLYFAESAKEAVGLFENRNFDLVVTDAKMPGLSGTDLLKEMNDKGLTTGVPTIMLTGFADDDLRKRAIEYGVIEFLNKPIIPEELVQRLRNVLKLKTIANELKEANKELKESNMQIIRRLGKAVEYRDVDTGKHVIRVAHYSKLLADATGIDKTTAELIFQTAPMHDIGKIAIPDEILKKKDKLKPVEYEVIQTHPFVGNEMLQPFSAAELAFYNQHMLIGENILGESDTPLLRMAASIAATHHERWDGSGYPNKLKGKAIPIEGRIVAVADVYDALSSQRPYKPAYPDDECLAIIEEMSGTALDPGIVASFVANYDAIVATRKILNTH